MCIITTSFSMITVQTVRFPTQLNEVALMSNSHFLSWSSHVAATQWKKSSCYCLLGYLLFLRICGILKMLKKQNKTKQLARFRLLLIRKVYFLNIQPTISYPCYSQQNVIKIFLATSIQLLEPMQIFKSLSVFIAFNIILKPLTFLVLVNNTARNTVFKNQDVLD